MKEERLLDNKLSIHFDKFKQALILLGGRQVGKTTILKKIFPQALYLLIDEENVYKNLERYSSDIYRSMIGDYKRVFIDEVHLLSDPGRAVKLMYDQIEDIEIIVTGSSSLHIKNKTAESMAGRAINYNLYPLTYGELLYQKGIIKDLKVYLYEKIVNNDEKESIKYYDIEKNLENILLYGQYPEILNILEKEIYLKNLIEKAIFKDIISLNLIEKRSQALKLLKLLAYQIGNIISYSELANKLQITAPTVQRYIDIFEQSFVLYRLNPFSKNGRNEIGKAPKIYFWDLGLRNALIGDFNDIKVRSDSGAMFENFIISEIKKEISYLDLNYKIRYWRLKSGSEVDLVLHNNDEVIGCEIKLNKGKVSRAFQNRYPKAKTHVITSSNFAP